MPFSDRAVLKVKKFFLVLSGGPPCGFNHTYLDSGLRVTQAKSPRMLCWSSVAFLLDKQCSSLCPWNFPGKSTGAGCHFLLQGIFLTQGSNPRLLHLLHWQRGS